MAWDMIFVENLLEEGAYWVAAGLEPEEVLLSLEISMKKHCTMRCGRAIHD